MYLGEKNGFEKTKQNNVGWKIFAKKKAGMLDQEPLYYTLAKGTENRCMFECTSTKMSDDRSLPKEIESKAIMF